ncbi:[F-actin]-monooxygenase Mical [Eumeta japonica]|uniref:[F-actin]-monooxygenase Mical n=1 Tax=Eumeta variegata TaxID=151549 RepID=A0A4C1TKG0_EUMVA|nr:[F-actin]-monooxygenase Mical [Eumeta japonica]
MKLMWNQLAVTSLLRGSRQNSQTSPYSHKSSNEKLDVKLSSDDEKQKPFLNTDNYDTDSLCTSISKSPSVAPITVQKRGSSEDESIEQLFSQFSDEMLVNVEFDSNDELVAITPRSPVKEDELVEQDILDEMQSLKG